jgi:cytochrome P450
MTVSTAGDVYFDPYDHQLVVDPYPMYRRMRDEAPLYHNAELGFFSLSRWADVQKVLQDFETYSSGRGNILEIIKSDFQLPPGSVIFEDPPMHTAHRKMLSRMFTPKRINALEPKIRELCVEAMDPLVGSGGFDLIADVGAHVPMRAIGMLLGVPEDAQAAIRDAVDGALRTEAGQTMTQEDILVDSEVFGEYVDWRLKNPGDDIISQLLTTQFEDETGTRRTMTREEVLAFVTVLGGAGNETTTRLLGWAGKLLSEHPDQRADLVADPSLIPNAIEETLRMEPPGPFMCRYVTRDVEHHGTTVPAGDVMMVMLAAANRDERRYQDPDRYDVHRKDIEHLTFGGGIHFCMGNALARLEGRLLLEELLKRFPTWTAQLDQAVMSPTSTVRGWETMPISVP